MTRRMTRDELVTEIQRLKKEKQAVVLAHNYQVSEVQAVADFVGDSLDLSLRAAETDARIIVFAGVHFMAETAAILSPDKKVLIPSLEAGCSLADSVTAEDILRWREKHPEGVVVSYVNTTAEVKAVSDYCCTSSNAVKVVAQIPEGREILFVPDFFLGTYVMRQTGRRLTLWPGHCHVHYRFTLSRLLDLLEAVPEARLLVHPESQASWVLSELVQQGRVPADRVQFASTGGMVRAAAEAPEGSVFLIATEVGLVQRLQREFPNKTFMPVDEEAVCEFMKMTTLEGVYRSLRDEVYPVTVPEEIRQRAERALRRMLEIR